jgi:hypothetical protein
VSTHLAPATFTFVTSSGVVPRSLLRNSAKHLKSLESGKMQFANDFKDFHVLRGHSATRS